MFIHLYFHIFIYLSIAQYQDCANQDCAHQNCARQDCAQAWCRNPLSTCAANSAGALGSWWTVAWWWTLKWWCNDAMRWWRMMYDANDDDARCMHNMNQNHQDQFNDIYIYIYKYMGATPPETQIWVIQRIKWTFHCITITEFEF